MSEPLPFHDFELRNLADDLDGIGWVRRAAWLRNVADRCAELERENRLAEEGAGEALRLLVESEARCAELERERDRLGRECAARHAEQADALERIANPYGFTWGRVDVERMAEANGYKVIGVKVNGQYRVQIQVSPKGRSVNVLEIPASPAQPEEGAA